jgi:hypothetical protein
MPGHGIFGDFFVSVAQTGYADKVPVFDFFDNINIFNAAGPAFYAITSHHHPPNGVSYSIFGGIPDALDVFLSSKAFSGLFRPILYFPGVIF